MVSIEAMVSYLTHAAQTVHAEDRMASHTLAKVRDAGTVGPEDFETLMSAQQTALRTISNTLLMLSAYIESTTPIGRASRTSERAHRSTARRILVRLLSECLKTVDKQP